MKFKVFAIYDDKTGAYTVPFSKPTVGAGIRLFDDMVNNRDSEIGRHPEDYTLYLIGEYDDSNALFEAKEQSSALGNGRQMVRQSPEGDMFAK